ncbi:MAG: Holliday junction branch migration protein RuvA [Treponema sp.]|nr:Holliday junction branch migration protein RuvA [Treponema sp.]
MINSLKGIANGKTGEALYLLCGDIEWEIAMPGNDLAGMEGECRVFTWLYHREDQMRLFGFASEKRRFTFLELLKVEGIGPKGAIKIMGGINQDDLERALEEGDLARLEIVPGLGRKTAQKMLLSLKGKLLAPHEDAAVSPYKDLIEALTEMGYDKNSAKTALENAGAVVSASLPAAEREKMLFKEAIVNLSGV